MARLHNSRERIGRAHQHWAAFNDAWQVAQKDGSYHVTVHVQDDGAGTVRVEAVRPLPSVLSLELGEMLYQLRAALDHCVYESGEISWLRSPAEEKSLEFPICTEERQWKAAARKIAPLSDEKRRIVEHVQPYNIGKHVGTAPVIRALGILNDWARKDRHRRLHILRSIPRRVVKPRVNGDYATLGWVQYAELHYLEHDPVTARFGIEDWTPGAKVEIDQHVMLEIAVDEPAPREPDGDTLKDRVEAMFYAVKWVVEEFERLP
jgi:hypothetical protein